MLQVLSDVAVELDQADLASRAHVQAEDMAVFAGMIEQARDIARPKVLYREVAVGTRDGDRVEVGGQVFTSRMLARNLREVDRVFAFVATCGMELEAANPPGDDFLADFWWETIKAAVLGCAIHHFCQHLERRHGVVRSAMMNPGSGDANVWPIQQQKPLFELLGGVTEQIGVELTDTFLMRPDKTISGVRFVTRRDIRACQVCHREPCASRSAPFDPKLWEEIGHE